MLKSYKCPNCGADVTYAPGKQKLYCEYCETELFVEMEQREPASPEVTSHEVSYNSEDSDKYILPFKVDEQTAREKYLLKTVRGASLQQLRGVYVPYYRCNYHAEITLRGTGTKVRTERKTSGRTYKYTDTYVIERLVGVDYKDITLNVSGEIPQAWVDALEPFDYDEKVPFDPGYLTGFDEIPVTSNLKNLWDDLDKKMTEYAAEDAWDTVKGYKKVQDKKEEVTLEKKNMEQVLVPVWIAEYHGDKGKYIVLVEGQSGMSVEFKGGAV